jgi:hypothetical protein
VRKRIERKDYAKLRKRLLFRLRDIRTVLFAAYASSDFEVIADQGDFLWKTQMLLARIRKRYYRVPKSKGHPASVIDQS